jgi:hypothetical protein
MELKPIETVYKGYRFRSRLEARWAVFLDSCGLRWDYEREGYDLDGIWYLPDFWVEPQPDSDGYARIPGFWLEIKGAPCERGSLEWKKAQRLALASGSAVYMFLGQIDAVPHGLRFQPWEEDDGSPPEPELVRWVICPLCEAFEPARGADDMSCVCVAVASGAGALEVALTKARQARFEHRRKGD